MEWQIVTLFSPGPELYRLGPFILRWYGILIAIAEMCIAGNLGLTIDTNPEFPHGFYFGEDQSRYLIEIKPENFDRLKQIAKSKNVDFEKIGVINREIIRINNSNEIKISELKKNFEQGVENI